MIRTLIDFIESSPSKKAIMPDILKSLKKFDEEIISYQTIIQPIISGVLNIFDSKTGENPNTSSAGRIFDALAQEYKHAVQKLEADFNDEENNVYSEPNGVAFDIAKNFASNIIGGSRYTSRLYDGNVKDSVKIETQWRALYRYIRGDIWPEEFRAGQVRREALVQIRKPFENTAALLNHSFNLE